MSYRGRFAPSPSGALHLGSLAAALGSYLDARHHTGEWLLRIEDIDTPRVVAGAADQILRTLEQFGLHWDGAVRYQSRHLAEYAAALQQLKMSAAAYPCACSRREIADSSLTGIEGAVYPGTCRAGLADGRAGRAWRVRSDGAATLGFADRWQGWQQQHVPQAVGDFVVQRADGLFAYQLAVVVDDAAQGITDVVRGCDLLASTPRQIWLQRLLGLPQPRYLHLPLLLNAHGQKLSKQNLAQPVAQTEPVAALWQALDCLQQSPPVELKKTSVTDLLAWAVPNWRVAAPLASVTVDAG